MTDMPAKIDRLRVIMARRDVQALQITAPEHLAWLLDGARTTVPFGGPAVASALVRADATVVVSALANEAARLRDEELAHLDGIDVVAVAWHEDVATPVSGAIRDTEVKDDMRAARASLLPGERARYSQWCAQLAVAVGDVARDLRATDTEREVSARLLATAGELGAEPVVVLVGGQTRTHVPHPLPTDARIGRRAVLALGARRHGMVANLTRVVSLGGAAHDGEDALRQVEADAFAATAPGRPLGEVLADVAASYERHGLGTHAWLAHHQGGPTGYLGRDPKVMPGESATVHAGQAFAWNPWIPGAKIEDTVIVDTSTIEVLTADPDWPTVDVHGIARPLTLELESEA